MWCDMDDSIWLHMHVDKENPAVWTHRLGQAKEIIIIHILPFRCLFGATMKEKKTPS